MLNFLLTATKEVWKCINFLNGILYKGKRQKTLADDDKIGFLIEFLFNILIMLADC